MSTIINFIFYSIQAGTPLLFGTTGEIITEKSGSLNLGVEGMMAMGAIGGYYIGCKTDSFLLALLAAFAFAALGALIYAFLTVTMQANQNVTGLSLTIFGVGVYHFIGKSLLQSGNFPKLNDAEHLNKVVSTQGIPFLRDFTHIGKLDISYISKLLFSYNIFVYIAIIIAVISWIYIYKSRQGLKLCAIGENPAAADAGGVRVNFLKYLNITLGGGICGLGGLYLGLVTNGGGWNDFWINGMGWISVALVIFAKWSTARAIFGAFFFGMLNTLQAWKGNLSSAYPVLTWLNKIPDEFYQMLPFFITAVVIIAVSVRKNKKSAEPSYIGQNYFREER